MTNAQRRGGPPPGNLARKAERRNLARKAERARSPPDSALSVFRITAVRLEGRRGKLFTLLGGLAEHVAQVLGRRVRVESVCRLALFGRRVGQLVLREVCGRADAVATRPLGLVEGAVGGRHQKLARACVEWEGRDAEGCRDRADARNFRALDARAQALVDDERALLAGLRKYDGELLAAVARGGVHAAHLLAQSARQEAQRGVARVVAVRVVDALEVVDV